MTFKSLCLSLCLMFSTAFAFATPADVNPATDQYELATIPGDVLPDATITFEDASCTVSATANIAGQEISISATAETCSEAVDMVLEVVGL